MAVSIMVEGDARVNTLPLQELGGYLGVDFAQPVKPKGT
jgi:hypothetical protein